MAKKQDNSVDAYIVSFPAETQKRLTELRSIIIKSAPEAEEIFGYKMPAYKMRVMLVYFAGYKNHIGFYPGAEAVKVFAKDITKYKTSKGAIQFPIDKPIPVTLVSRIVKQRVRSEKEKTALKAVKKSRE